MPVSIARERPEPMSDLRILSDAFIPELPGRYNGKVRENYDLPDGSRIIVATDRLSAFDVILTAIPFKGQVLTQTARYWFERTADIGFLASDGDICAFAQAAAAGQPDEPRRHALEARFAEYVRKYSEYHDIILLSPEGDTMARLQPATGP